MRYSRILRVITRAMIISLCIAVLLVLPVSPILAAGEDIYLDPDSGEIGDKIDIEGQDFDESYYNDDDDYRDVLVNIYFSADEADEDDDIDDEVENYEKLKSSIWIDYSGDFDTSFTVPDELTDGDSDEDVIGGTYYVYVTYSTSKNIVALAEFSVTAGEISLSPTRGPVGSEITISGEGYAGNDEITVEYDDSEIDIIGGDLDTDSDGDFVSMVLVPESAAGLHTIVAKDEAGSPAEASFTVEPQITASSSSGTIGDSLTISGTGFSSARSITLTYNNASVATTPSTVVTSTKGSFSATFTVPVGVSGTKTISASDGTNQDSTEFTVSATASISQETSAAAPGNVGMQLSISGTGFRPNYAVTVYYSGMSLATATTDASGDFTALITIPSSPGGEKVIEVRDDTNTKGFLFFMEQTAPPIPQPLLPEDGGKAEAAAHFDWGNVTDPSGLTYTLQISQDQSFNSITLEKKGLTTSEYTLTEAEKLTSNKSDEPYYWRVRAVDRADNASGWTTPGSFNVGFSFSLQGWLLYVVCAIAAILFLGIGFLLGRRSAAYS